MKDEVVRRTHDCAVKFVEQVQFCSQWKNQVERDHHPTFWTVMMNIDGLILDPNKPGANGRKDRDTPVVNFFGQEGIPIPVLAKILKKTAKKMLNGDEEGWTMASDSEEFATNTFGQRKNRVPKKHHTIVKAMAEEKEELSKKRLKEEKPNQEQDPFDRRSV
jgi:hypothetical protein